MRGVYASGAEACRKALERPKLKDVRTWGFNPNFAPVDCVEAYERLLEEVESLRAFKRGVDEALNSGDGVYRP